MAETKSVKGKSGYMSNKELYDEVLKCQREGQVSDKLARMFMLLCEKNATHRYFVRYPYKDDLISAGILACINGYDKFDPNRGDNCFAYFTSVIWNSYKMFLKKEYNYKNTKDALMVENNLNPSYGYTEAQEAMERKKNKLHDHSEGEEQNDGEN